VVGETLPLFAPSSRQVAGTRGRELARMLAVEKCTTSKRPSRQSPKAAEFRRSNRSGLYHLMGRRLSARHSQGFNWM